MNVGAAIAYSTSVSPPSEGRPRFTITSNSRSGRGAMIVADLVQSEYEKLHKSKKSLQVESVRNILVDLLEKSIETENELSKEMSNYKRTNNLPFLEDEKKDTADRKSQYQAEITTCKLEQIE